MADIDSQSLKKMAKLRGALAKLQGEIAKIEERVHSGDKVDKNELGIKIRELTNHELVARPVNHAAH
jgi:hypothetical protein